MQGTNMVLPISVSEGRLQATNVRCSLLLQANVVGFGFRQWSLKVLQVATPAIPDSRSAPDPGSHPGPIYRNAPRPSLCLHSPEQTDQLVAQIPESSYAEWNS